MQEPSLSMPKASTIAGTRGNREEEGRASYKLLDLWDALYFLAKRGRTAIKGRRAQNNGGVSRAALIVEVVPRGLQEKRKKKKHRMLSGLLTGVN